MLGLLIEILIELIEMPTDIIFFAGAERPMVAMSAALLVLTALTSIRHAQCLIVSWRGQA